MTRILILLAVLAPIGLAVIACARDRNTSSFAQPVGELRTTRNPALEANIDSFMESKKSELDLGTENYHCASILYGYDDRYAYAWMVCKGHVRGDGKWQTASGFSVPIRLEYDSPDFRVVGFKMPGDGAAYMPSWKQLFPKQMHKGHISDTELQALNEEIAEKAAAVPLPTNQ